MLSRFSTYRTNLLSNGLIEHRPLPAPLTLLFSSDFHFPYFLPNNPSIQSEREKERKTLHQVQKMEDHVEVARPFDEIKEIDETKDVWTLAVRIVDLWPVIGKYNSEHLEMIVKDAEGDVIHITISKEFLAPFKDVLHLNNTYEMDNFKVANNDLVVKACDHRFRLIVTGATVIRSQDFPDIPMATLNFKDFGEVLAGKYRQDLLVDAIGAFQEVTNTNKSSGRLRSITFTLKDASANILHCCLWDDHAKLCADTFSKLDGRQLTVIVLKHARVKAETGIYPLCFTNTWDGTQVLFNPELPHVAEFIKNYKALPADAVGGSQSASQFSQSSQYSQNQDIMSKATFMTLAEINNVKKETLCVTVAKIKKLNATRHGWLYDGCNECTKSVRMDGGKLKCTSDHVNEKPLPRYKVEVQAVHNSDKARFLFWDAQCAEILKISAADLRAHMIKAGLTNPRTYPKVLDQLLSEKKVFKVKAHPGGNPAFVLQISDSEPLLKNLETQFGLLEASSSKQPLGLEIVSESLDTSKVTVESLCGDYDPNITSSTPPAKRLSLDDPDSENISSTPIDLQPTQLSTTKLVKNPKNAKTPKLER